MFGYVILYNHSKGQTRTKLNQTAGVRKEKTMEDMNSFELETFLKMILEILNGCNDLKEAQEKIKALLKR